LNFRKLAIFSCIVIFFLAYSCVPFWAPADKFSRTYGLDFMSFHPKLNSALQDYAKRHKGNFFRVAHLGSDTVIMQGSYKGGQYQVPLSTTITVKPAGPRRTWVEIKISSTGPKISSEYLKEAAGDLFQIIEQGAGVRPPE
jgi:hypothetical protein